MDAKARPRAAHPLWYPVLAAFPAVGGLALGPRFIDDAYITFRYAENLAAGRGFVFNSEPVLGTTTPLYCFLLTGAKLAGVSIPTAALAIGIFTAALAPVLCWRLGIELDRPRAGLLGGLLLALFPHWTAQGVTGMESTMAASLALLAILLDLRGPAWAAGPVLGFLTLTRPDLGILPVTLFIKNLVTDRKKAVWLAAGGGAVIIVWAAYAVHVFGTPLPHSLAAKRFVHPYPWFGVGFLTLSWFFNPIDPPGMTLMGAIWIFGTIKAVRLSRDWMVASAWPLIFIAALSATEIWPFPWYKFPIVPAIFLLVGLGVDDIFGEADVMTALKRGTGKARARAALGMLPALVVAAQVGLAAPELWRGLGPEQRAPHREEVYHEMSEMIRSRTLEAGLDPRSTRVYVGEAGVIGYDLLEYQIIDFSGINSPELLRLRERDWARVKAEHPEFSTFQQWWGSDQWSMSAIEEYRPEFIASQQHLLNLWHLQRKPEFNRTYQVLKSWSDPFGFYYLLLERKDLIKP